MSKVVKFGKKTQRILEVNPKELNSRYLKYVQSLIFVQLIILFVLTFSSIIKIEPVYVDVKESV
jgi:hypothetical protein